MLARIVGEGRHDSIGIGDRERLSEGVIGRECRDMARGIGDGVDLSALGPRRTGVIRVRRGVGDIRARSIGGEHVAKPVIRVRPGARDIGRDGRIGLGPGQHVAGAIVGKARGLQRCAGRTACGIDRNRDRLPKRAVPGSLDRACPRGPGGLRPQRLQSPGIVIRVLRGIPVVVLPGTHVAGRIVGGGRPIRTRRAPRAAHPGDDATIPIEREADRACRT